MKPTAHIQGKVHAAILPTVVAAFAIVAMAAILFPVFASARMGGKSICVNHLMGLVNDASLYANDHDDRLPLAATWMDGLSQKWATWEEALHDKGSVKSDEYGYAYRTKASGQPTHGIKNPKTYMLIFDSTLLGRNASSGLETLPRPGRHRGSNTIAYLDGHVRRRLMP